MASITYTQNLISNPGFEESVCCPSVYSMFYCVQDWITPTKGTTDYYSNCVLRHESPIVQTPTNFFGHQNTIDGIAYAGFYTFYDRDYREYMLTQLTQPLDSGKVYHVNFWVSLADTAGVAVRSVGVAFMDTLYRSKQFSNITNVDFIPIYQSDSTFLTNKKRWVQLKIDYTARGGERFFMLGNFYDNENTDTLSIGDTSTADFDRYDSYYYIDAVCVGLRRPDGTCACINEGEPVVIDDHNYVDLEEIEVNESADNRPQVGDIVILEDIYFDFDKATLKETSEPELLRLYHLLIQYPALKVRINGHTDNRGSKDYNLLLSESRALSVYAWLIDKGIDSSRLDFKGYGKFRPIATNKTDEGRQENRRVEFEVIDN